MQYKQFNKISFNNFKAFGEKMQKINHKPITLVYGANSIGKSSLVHFMLYLQYMIKTDNINLNETNIFGDTLDLGGFNKFLHGRDTDKAIEFEIEIDDKNNINNIIAGLFGEHQSMFLVPKFYRIFESLTYTELEEIVDYLYKNEKVYDEKKKMIDKYYKFSSKKDRKNNNLYKKYSQKNNLYKIEKYFDSLSKNNKSTKNTEILMSLIEMIEADIASNLIKYKTYIEYFESIQKMKIAVKIKQSYMYVEYSIDDLWFFSTGNSMKKDETYDFDNAINKDHNLFKILSNLVEYLNEAKLPVQKSSGWVYGDLDDAKNIFFSERHHVARDFRFDSLLYNVVNRSIYSSWVEPDNGNYYSRNGELLIEEWKDIDNFDDKDLFFWYLETEKNGTEFMFYNESIMTGVFTLLALKTTEEIIGSSKYTTVQYIGPMRFYPERIDAYRKKSFVNKEILDSKDSWYYLKENESLRKRINEWLSDSSKLRTPYKIEFKESYKIDKKTLNEMLSCSDDTLSKILHKVETIEEMVIVDERSGIALSNRDIGLGVSQIMPILIFANHHKNALLSIEQPELHLHPGIQSELADEFIRSYKKNHNEFIIETHSEHLLLRIMKRMRHTAEGKIAKSDVLALTPDDVCLLYVDNDGKNTFINELELDEDGTLLDPWPNGFFEEGHRERFD